MDQTIYCNNEQKIECILEDVDISISVTEKRVYVFVTTRDKQPSVKVQCVFHGPYTGPRTVKHFLEV